MELDDFELLGAEDNGRGEEPYQLFGTAGLDLMSDSKEGTVKFRYQLSC